MSWYDYPLFGASLLVAAFIGLIIGALYTLKLFVDMHNDALPPRDRPETLWASLKINRAAGRIILSLALTVFQGVFVVLGCYALSSYGAERYDAGYAAGVAANLPSERAP